MKWIGLFVAVSVLGILGWRLLRVSPYLVAGDLAPPFELTDQHGKLHELDTYRGRWLVLYFYPRDDTPGCTREACGFRDDILKIKTLNAEVIGVSVDDAASHARFASQHHLPFALLADTKGETAAAYGALLRLGPWQMARRHTFIVTPQGRVGRVFRQVKPDQHAAEVARTLKELQIKNNNDKPVPGPNADAK